MKAIGWIIGGVVLLGLAVLAFFFFRKKSGVGLDVDGEIPGFGEVGGDLDVPFGLAGSEGSAANQRGLVGGAAAGGPALQPGAAEPKPRLSFPPLPGGAGRGFGRTLSEAAASHARDARAAALGRARDATRPVERARGERLQGAARRRHAGRMRRYLQRRGPNPLSPGAPPPGASRRAWNGYIDSVNRARKRVFAGIGRTSAFHSFRA